MSAEPGPARALPPGWRWLLLGMALPVAAIAFYASHRPQRTHRGRVFAMALQKGGATAVTAIRFTTNTALSSLIGLAYLDDRVRTGFAAVAVVGFVLAITGAVGAAHYASRARHKSSTTSPRRGHVAT